MLLDIMLRDRLFLHVVMYYQTCRVPDASKH